MAVKPRVEPRASCVWAVILCSLSMLRCAGGAPARPDAGTGQDTPGIGENDGGGRPQDDAGPSGGRSGTASNAGRGGRGDSDAAVDADGASGGTGGRPDSDASAGGDAGAGGLRWTESPWGVAPSHSSSVGIASWAEAIAQSGVDWIRGFDQGNAQSVLPIATANGFHVAGIFDYSPPGGPATFPVADIAGLQAYVAARIAETSGVVEHWEVWNEPPNFSENKSPADYAAVVVAAYDAAKAADPTVQVGLAAQSVNLNFMAQALDAGAADHFDYVTVHPYETLGLVEDGWEAQYMSIVPTIRKLLAEKNPARQDVPVWFTELGEPVGGEITPEHQADTLVKAYVMGLAQGAHRIHWFEPLDGDSGPFGLIAGGNGAAPRRPSFIAVQTLITELGTLPSYLGWTLLNDRHYAFVFEGPNDAVMVAWTAAGVTDSVDFDTTVVTIDPHTAAAADTDAVALGHAPVLIRGVPAALVADARTHAGQPLAWDGSYAAATSVEYSAADGARGLHPVGDAALVTIDGAAARDISQGPALAFTVDPSFLAYDATPLLVTAVVRNNDATGAGFNVKYESTSGWKGTGSWYNVPGADHWYTQTWTLPDPQFVGKWGYHFAFDSDSTQHSNYSVLSVTVSKQ